MSLYTQGHYAQMRFHQYSTRLLRPSRLRPRHLKSRPVSVSPLSRSGYSCSPFIAKSKAACGLCFRQLDGNVELPWLMRKYAVIRKTRSTQHIAMPPEEDRAMAIGNMHRNLVKIRHVLYFQRCSQADKHTDRHDHQNTLFPDQGWSNDIQTHISNSRSHFRSLCVMPSKNGNSRLHLTALAVELLVAMCVIYVSGLWPLVTRQTCITSLRDASRRSQSWHCTQPQWLGCLVCNTFTFICGYLSF